MDTFPYDSWEEAIAAADGTTSYATWGTGDNLASVILVLIALAVFAYTLWSYVTVENKHLNEAAKDLASKYRGG